MRIVSSVSVPQSREFGTFDVHVQNCHHLMGEPGQSDWPPRTVDKLNDGIGRRRCDGDHAARARMLFERQVESDFEAVQA